MNGHEFMVGLAASTLGYARLPYANELPSLVHEHTDADALWNDVYRDAYNDAQCGRGDYWPRNSWKTAADGPKFDDEQSIDIVLAAQLAKALIGASDAERWQAFNRLLGESIDAYARTMADVRMR